MTHTVFSSLLALVMIFPAASGKTTECGKQTLTPTQVGYNYSSAGIVNTEINKGDDDPIVPPNYRLNSLG